MDPCYTSKEFREFLEFYQVHHITSSPHHPRCNGFAEALMGIAKRLMDKAIKDGKPWNYGLLQYRVMPISSTIPSPLEALTGRKLRTSLPQVPSTIGRTVDGSRIHQELIKRQPHALTQHGTGPGTRTTSVCQRSARKCLEDSHCRSTCQRT